MTEDASRVHKMVVRKAVMCGLKMVTLTKDRR